MKKSMQRLHPSGLLVEVSGWDVDDRSFVELSTLDSTELGSRTLLLRHAVQIRSLIFIRPLLYDSFAKSHPQTHHVEVMQLGQRSGCRVHLERFPQSDDEIYEPKGPAKHPIDVREEVKS
jgi:hypothetical protein